MGTRKSVYSLPFSLGETGELFIEKTGNVFRPAIDQLPGTNTEFYLLQNGLAFKDEEQSCGDQRYTINHFRYFRSS